MRVVIIDDQELFAEAMRSLLLEHGIQVVATAGTGQGGIDTAAREQPDVVLLDLLLPDISGLAVGKRILEKCPETKVLALTGLTDPRTAREVIQAGFHGYLTKQTRPSHLVDSIKAVADGQAVLPYRLAASVAGMRSLEEEQWALLESQLTSRERQILGMLVQGASSKEIATRLALRPNTVRSHVQNVLNKLQVHSRLEAVTLASRHPMTRTPNHDMAS